MSVELPSQKMKLVDHGVESGVQWVTCEAPLYGAINGYVKIPAGHHWHGLDYDEIGVDVHGGLTYGGGPSGWIGFDCLHFNDWWPGRRKYEGAPGFSDTEWTPEMVADETRRLARNVAAAGYDMADLSGSYVQMSDD